MRGCVLAWARADMRAGRQAGTQAGRQWMVRPTAADVRALEVRKGVHVAQGPSMVVAQGPSMVVAQGPSMVAAQGPSMVAAQGPSMVVAQGPSMVAAQRRAFIHIGPLPAQARCMPACLRVRSAPASTHVRTQMRQRCSAADHADCDPRHSAYGGMLIACSAASAAACLRLLQL